MLSEKKKSVIPSSVAGTPSFIGVSLIFMDLNRSPTAIIEEAMASRKASDSSGYFLISFLTSPRVFLLQISASNSLDIDDLDRETFCKAKLRVDMTRSAMFSQD